MTPVSGELWSAMFTSELIQRALDEDVGRGDITTDATVPPELRGIGKLKAKQELVVCGLGVFGAVFSSLDPSAIIAQYARDGDEVREGQVLASVTSSFSKLLKAERVALNFIQRLSGIATLTRSYVEKTHGFKTKILDTRKTTPLLRHLEKYAVKTGGAQNHRSGLYDQILIKDNHIAACGHSAKLAVERVRACHPGKKIVIEVSSPDQIPELIPLGVDRFLLDNMSKDAIVRCLERVKGKATVEVSGGVTLDQVRAFCELGVDYISVGALTHSARAADLNFKVEIL